MEQRARLQQTPILRTLNTSRIHKVAIWTEGQPWSMTSNHGEVPANAHHPTSVNSAIAKIIRELSTNTCNQGARVQRKKRRGRGYHRIQRRNQQFDETFLRQKLSTRNIIFAISDNIFDTLRRPR